MERKNTGLLLVVCLVGLLALGCGVEGKIQVKTSSRMYVDEYYRERIFHGVNVVYKGAPYHPNLVTFSPQDSLTTADIQNLKQWGFNAVRLGVMWTGLFPAKNQVNSTYLNIINQIVSNLANAGIYTIIDAHQDLFSRKFCGEGVPDWAVQTTKFALEFPIPALGFDVFPVDKNGYPPLDLCLQHIFGLYYTSQIVNDAFQQFYNDTNGIQEEFGKYWRVLSSSFKSNPYVLAYELINEPWPGDVYTHPTLLYPGVADRDNLFPLYVKLNQIIRNLDTKTIVFYEKSLIDQVNLSGFPYGPGGKVANDKQAYSYHIYCGAGTPRNIIACDAINGYLEAVNIYDLERMGVAGFMTEFGAVSNKTNGIAELQLLTEFADLWKQSWTYWQFKKFGDYTTAGPQESFYSDNGQLEVNKVKSLSRTYPQATAGTLIKTDFRPDTSYFQMRYAVNTSISQPTEIYLNEKYYYATGYQVTIAPNVASWTTPGENRVNILPSSAAKTGDIITVTIQPKQ